MKYLHLVAALSLLVVSGDQTLTSSTEGKTLREVYGDVEEPSGVVPYHMRPTNRSGATRFTSEYLLHRTPEDCDFPLEIVIVQDLTASFEDDIDNMRSTQLQAMIDGLIPTHPGSAFATISFKDKPLWPLGEIDDYCVKMASPLSTDPAIIVNDYSQWAVYGGGDPPESSFHALVAAAQSDTPGWGSVPTAARLIVMVTDAAPHFEGDGFNSFGLPNFSGVFDEANNDQQCITQYYPNPATVKQAIASRQVYLASLVYGGSHDSGLPIESWKWFNNYIGQTAGFVYDLEHDSSDFWSKLSEIITLLEDIECGLDTTTPAPATTTTPAPATTTTPTPATTTTPAPATTTTPAPATTAQPDITVTPVGTVEPTLPTECPPCETECPPCPPATECAPCCCEGALIKLNFKPKKLQLLVEN